MPVGRHHPRAGRHRARARGAGRRRRRRSSCCPARRASCTRCGRPRWRPTPSARPSPGAVELRQEMLRLFGIPESEIAETLRLAEDAHGLEGLEITTCLRRGEVEVVTRFSPAAPPRLRALRRDRPRAPRRHAVLRRRAHGRPAGGRPAARARASRSPRPSRARAGCWPARLTDLAGSSDYVLGGLVVYSNEAKAALAGVDPALIERVGAVSLEVAEALADGARARAGRGRRRGHHGRRRARGRDARASRSASCAQRGAAGGTASRLTRCVNLPGDRADVRDRSTTVAMHLVRRLLLGGRRRRARPAMSARLFAALELPADVRAGLAAFGREAAARRPRAAPVARGRAAPDARLPRPPRARRGRPRARGRARRGRLAGARADASPTRCGWPRAGRTCSRSALEDADGVLAALQAAVVERLADALPWQPEARPFRAHVTVARVRREWRPRHRRPARGAAGDLHRRRGGALPLAPGRRRTGPLRAARARGAGARSANRARRAAASSQSRVEP